MPCPHVFLTRFNLPTNKIENKIYSTEWLSERMELFQRYTIPSMLAQEAQDRYWIIYLDPASPTWVTSVMDDLSRDGIAHPHYPDAGFKPAQVHGHLTALLGRDSGPVVTSNLDNDDGLASDYLARLRREGFPHAPFGVYYTRGLVRQGGSLYLHRDPHNAFAAVYDTLESRDFQFCWSQWHNRLHRAMPVDRRGGPPMWLQVVHGRNVSNRVRGRLIDARAHRDRFPGLLDDLDRPDPTQVWQDRFVFSPGRAVRDRVRGDGARLVVKMFGESSLETVKNRLRGV